MVRPDSITRGGEGSARSSAGASGAGVPDGSEIDTRNGIARVTVASDRRGGLSTATVSKGRAIIDQNAARAPPPRCG